MVDKYLVSCILLLVSIVGGKAMSNVTPGGGSLTQANTSAGNAEYERDLSRIEALRASKDIDSLVVVADEMEKKWDRRNGAQYGTLILSVAKSFSSANVESSRKTTLAQKYALSALKRFESIPTEIALSLISFLQVDIDTSQDLTGREGQRRGKAILWLRGWQRLESEIDKNFDVNDAPRGNISPPASTGLPSGVAPDAIENPKLRREYENALAKNAAKAQKFNRQYRLRQLNQTFPKQAEQYIIDAYSRQPFNLEELKRLLDTYTSDLNARKRIINEVTKKVSG